MKRKTTHEMAHELLALPDVKLLIEMWCPMENHEMAVEICNENEAAIIWQKPIPNVPE